MSPTRAKKVITTTTTTSSTPPKPKAKKARRKSRTNGGKSKVDLYLQSLLFPTTTPARIPDVSGLPTSTFTLSYDGTLTVNASGSGGISVFLDSWGGLTTGLIVYTESAGSTDATFAYNAGVQPAGTTSISASFAATRLVSACLEVEYLGSTLNDAGRLQGATTFTTPGYAEPVPTSVGTMLSMRDNVALMFRDGIMVRYRPLDNNADEFVGNGTGNRLGNLIAHVSGAVAGVIARYRLVCNYEGLPLADTLSYVTASPSPVDPTSYLDARATVAKASSFMTWKHAMDVIGIGAWTAGVEMVRRNVDGRNFPGAGRRLY